MRVTVASKIFGMVFVFAMVTWSGIAMAVTPCPLVKDDVYNVLTDTVFAVFDLNGNGYITVAEVDQISPELADSEVGDYISKWPNGISRWWFHRALETFDVLSFVDINDDGLISYAEVSEYITEDIFAYLDPNGNGAVDCEDWARLTEPYMSAEGEEACGTRDMLALIVNGIVRFVDLNNNGEVSYTEVYLLAGEDTDIVFGALDRNGDDVITEPELFALLVSIPINVVNVLDMNGDGSFQHDEVSFVPDLLFLLLDKNHDDVLDCADAPEAPPEGESEGEGETVIEGEEPPVEGEAPVEGEGEDVEAPCPLPTVSLEDILDIVVPYVDANGDGSLSMAEITAVYPDFEQSWFDSLDVNNDGLVSRIELLGLAGILAVHGDVIFLIDMNGDRLIQYAEVEGYIGLTEFDYLDTNLNGVLDCEDLDALLPDPEGEVPVEGEEPPVEGEEPPVEGEEPPIEGEGEPIIGACPLPPVYVEDVVAIGMPYVDANDDGALSLGEITAIYPDFTQTWFDMVDKNSDGLITPAEILSVVSILPVERDLVLLVDNNDDRLIQYSEVSNILEQTVFDSLDLNANGVLDCEDLEGLMPVVEGELPAEGEISGEGEEPVEGEGEGDWGWVPFPGEGALSGRIVRMLLGMFVEMDVDGDNALTYEEIMAVVPLPENMFVMLDEDGDGFLTYEELNTARRRFLESPGEAIIQVIRAITGVTEGNFYIPGTPFTVTLQILKQGSELLNSLDLMEVIPEGWAVTILDKSDAQVSMKDDSAGQLVLFEWENPQAFPMTISYTVTPPADAKGMQSILGQAGYDVLGNVISGEIIPTVIAALLDVMETHSADSNHDWRISLRELLRVIQLFNSIGYHCSLDSEDGYAPGVGDIADCLNHLADYTGDWVIDLSELLRLIQLYNSDSGYYYISDKTEDGYMVAPF